MPKRKAADVGDEVTFRVGQRQLHGHVIEDRGAIGVGGRRLLRIRVGLGSDAHEYELPAAEVARAGVSSHRATG
jgi:hypothetical protein